ncbi:MAG: heme-binding protein [Terriglobales bacterium]
MCRLKTNRPGNPATRQHRLPRISALSLALCSALLFCLSCGGGVGTASSSSDPPPQAVPLSASDVTTIVQAAVNAVNAPMVVGVSDRAGNILAVYDTAGAPTTSLGNFGGLLADNLVAANDLAAALARTAAFFSNDQAPLSSRTVRFISGIHFPPGIANTPNADLYGIENTNRGCTLAPPASFLPGQGLTPSTLLDGTVPGLGIVTGKVDTNDSPPSPANPGVNPSGVPIFRGGFLVGGIGVVSTSIAVSEYAAFTAAFPTGLPQLPPPGAVVIGGIAVPFVNQTSLPPGAAPGPFPGTGTYVVPPMPGVVPPEKYLIGPNAGQLLAASDVDEIITNAVDTAMITRAVIRLPENTHTAMSIAVSDLDGTILGLYRMHDGTVFSVDVASSKARNVVWFSTTGVADLPGVPSSTAVTNRTISFGSQPLFPPGIDGSNPGPFFPLYLYDTANPCTQGPSSAAFPPNTNNMSGVVFFPGSLPLYRNGVLVGGLGVSGDGVDQDDFVTAGAVNAACGLGGPCGIPDFQAPPTIRADQVVIDNVRLPYQKFPRNPTQ